MVQAGKSHGIAGVLPGQLLGPLLGQVIDGQLQQDAGHEVDGVVA